MIMMWWRFDCPKDAAVSVPHAGADRRGISAQIMRRAWVEAAGERAGNAAIEFAILAPVLLLILFGIVQFGITMNNYLELTGGVAAGGRQFAIGRSTTTPWTVATTTVTSSAPNLTAGNVKITLQVNGAACTTDTACETALSAAVGGSASVSASYPCNLAIMGVNYAPNCTLTAQATDLIE
jgi:Flp pilus assembly protein TadG